MTRGAVRFTVSRLASSDPGWFGKWVKPDADKRLKWHRFDANIQRLLEGDRRRTTAWLDVVDERLLVGNDAPEGVLDMAIQAILAGVPPEDFSPPLNVGRPRRRSVGHPDES
jgi:hypothetical protein